MNERLIVNKFRSRNVINIISLLLIVHRAASTHTISDEDLEVIQRFVILLYDRTSACVDVNQSRRELFTKKNRTVENIPPTLDALRLHIKRASLQSK